MDSSVDPGIRECGPPAALDGQTDGSCTGPSVEYHKYKIIV